MIFSFNFSRALKQIKEYVFFLTNIFIYIIYILGKLRTKKDALSSMQKSRQSLCCFSFCFLGCSVSERWPWRLFADVSGMLCLDPLGTF